MNTSYIEVAGLDISGGMTFTGTVFVHWENDDFGNMIVNEIEIDEGEFFASETSKTRGMLLEAIQSKCSDKVAEYIYPDLDTYN